MKTIWAVLSEDLWNSKGKERKVVTPGVKPRASGLSHQCAATEPRHPPKTTPSSSPFITLLWVTIDKIMCLIAVCNCWSWKGSVQNHSMGSLMDGTSHSLKTNRDCLIRHNLGLYFLPSTFLSFPLLFQRSSDSNGPDCLPLDNLYRSSDCGGVYIKCCRCCTFIAKIIVAWIERGAMCIL